MPLCIQDPSYEESEYLIDKLLEACQGAIVGGGAFAFLSAGGVRLFLRDKGFAGFMDGGRFDLVVGVDAITDDAAIAALSDAIAEQPRLEARVHLPSHPRSIFHPKFAWFRKTDGGILITGSGNLTAGGLRWNIEAFHVTQLDAVEINEVEQQWAAYKERCAENLFTTDHPKVAEFLIRNGERRRRQQERGRDDEAEGEETEVTEDEAPQPNETVDVDKVPSVPDDAEVLIAEIPKSGDRWKQVNFDLDTFINFFGASKTVARKAYFFHVRPDATVGTQEVRPAVTVVSKNYRFELDAAAGKEYPEVGRPIAIFVRVAVRTFTYMLLMPDDPTQSTLVNLLNMQTPNPGKNMRRIVFRAEEVRKAWPDSPLWKKLTI